MNFLIFRDFFRFFLNFSEFLMNFIEFKISLFILKINFISAQVTWRNLERQIARIIVTVHRHLKAWVRGTISLVGESFKNNLISIIDLRSYNS